MSKDETFFLVKSQYLFMTVFSGSVVRLKDLFLLLRCSTVTSKRQRQPSRPTLTTQSYPNTSSGVFLSNRGIGPVLIPSNSLLPCPHLCPIGYKKELFKRFVLALYTAKHWGFSVFFSVRKLTTSPTGAKQSNAR